MKQFEVWDADLLYSENSHVQGGHRPVIDVSNNAANTYSPAVTIVPLTSRHSKSNLPTHVWIDVSALPLRSLALCEQITTVDKDRLKKCIGFIADSPTRKRLGQAMLVQLGITQAATH